MGKSQGSMSPDQEPEPDLTMEADLPGFQPLPPSRPPTQDPPDLLTSTTSTTTELGSDPSAAGAGSGFGDRHASSSTTPRGTSSRTSIRDPQVIEAGLGGLIDIFGQGANFVTTAGYSDAWVATPDEKAAMVEPLARIIDRHVPDLELAADVLDGINFMAATGNYTFRSIRDMQVARAQLRGMLDTEPGAGDVDDVGVADATTTVRSTMFGRG